MTDLTHREFKDLLECIRRLHSCMEAEAFASHVLAALSKIIPASHVTYDLIDIRNMKMTHVATPFPAPQKLLQSFERYMHEHPWINIFYPRDTPPPFKNCLKTREKRPLGTALLMSDALPDSRFRRLSLYNEFYRHFDIEYQMVIPLMAGSDTLIGITFNRDRLDFSEKERLMLNILGPHVMQAFENAEAIAKLKSKIATLEYASGDGQNRHEHRPLPITGRENEVLHYVAMGKTNAEVAAILNISRNTVKTHLDRIYQKLGVENRTAASLGWLTKPY